LKWGPGCEAWAGRLPIDPLLELEAGKATLGRSHVNDMVTSITMDGVIVRVGVDHDAEVRAGV